MKRRIDLLSRIPLGESRVPPDRSCLDFAIRTREMGEREESHTLIQKISTESSSLTKALQSVSP